MEAEGRRALVVQGDVSDERQVEATFDQAVEAFGTVDILVNNAGVDALGSPIAELSTEVWDRAIRTNVYGYFFCCRRFAQLRTAAGGGGKVINVTSVHEDVPNAGGADYDCSKGAIRMLTRTLALELGEQREMRSTAWATEVTGGKTNSRGMTDHSLASTTGMSTRARVTCTPWVSR